MFPERPRGFLFFFLLAFLFFGAGAAPAQDETGTAPAGPEEAERSRSMTSLVDEGAVKDEEYIYINEDGTLKAIDDGYIEPRFVDLSKAYWAVGKFPEENNAALDMFLMINECELYQKYFNNEFEWMKVRDAARDHIRSNLASFPTKFEIVTPISLGRYDTEKEEFEVKPESQMTGTRKVDVINNSIADPVCGKASEIEGYPRNIIVELNRPLALLKLPVKRELALMFIEKTAREYANLDPRARMVRYEREAYIRLKVRLTQYKDHVYMGQAGVRALILAQLEGIEVYIDKERTMLMYRKNIMSKREQRVRELLEARKEAAEENTAPDSLSLSEEDTTGSAGNEQENPAPDL